MLEDVEGGLLVRFGQFFVDNGARLDILSGKIVLPLGIMGLYLLRKMINGSEVKQQFMGYMMSTIGFLLLPCPGLNSFPERDGLAYLVAAGCPDIA